MFSFWSYLSAFREHRATWKQAQWIRTHTQVLCSPALQGKPCLPQADFLIACIDAGFSYGGTSWNTLVQCVRLYHKQSYSTQSHPTDSFLRIEERELYFQAEHIKIFLSKPCQLSHLIKKHTSLGIGI